MPCDVEYTEAFEAWWNTLTEGEQEVVAAYVGMLEEKGTALGYPYSSGVTTSRHAHMRELRPQYKGNSYRILYAFDPRRVAILLVGGCKVGNDRWYEDYVPVADRIYDLHIRDIGSGR